MIGRALAMVAVVSAGLVGQVSRVEGQESVTRDPRPSTLDSIPRITLDEALRRAERLDPDYVQALGELGNAEWDRRTARLGLIVPSVNLSVDATKYSDAFFNIGTGQPQSTAVTARADAELELFSVRKFADLSRTAAEVDRAEADALEARFATALETESSYYAVLADAELTRVAEARVQRAQEALGVARARVISGAAVQTDSLQLVLELTEARVDLLRQRAALRVARLELGRRVGITGPVDAAPLDTAAPPPLPISVAEAVELAVAEGPSYQAARAAERAAEAEVRANQGDYLPEVTLSAAHNRFDNRFFPEARAISSLTIGVSLPIWNNGQRELALSEAAARRDLAEAIRQDLERGARADVTQAYEEYETARETIGLSETAVVVARENFRVQEARYRAGATTILDLLDAQLRLTQAEAGLVQARYSTRLALAGLEALLGRRLFTNE